MSIAAPAPVKMSTSLFLPLLPLEGTLTRHLPEKLTHSNSRRQSLVDFERNLEYDIRSSTRHGEQVSESEVDAMKRELHQWEGMTLSEKERWLEFKENEGLPLRKRSVAGAYEGGVVLV